MNVEILLGKTTEHLVPVEGTKFMVHKSMLLDFLKLQRDAQNAGFDLQIISAFRDYNRQLKIWNAKASGEKQLLDDQERPLDFSKLSPTEIMYAILRWSAIPGSSRHHWGTDIDIFDGKTQKPEEVKLVPSECEGAGPSSGLHAWLDDVLASSNSHGFFRPYRTDQGGVSPERWHLSYYPYSRRVLESYTVSLFKKNIFESEIVLKDVLLEHSEEIFHRYFLNFDLP
jgi:LAS superfamily LD-carboxypeptidase LdcB